MSHRERTPLTAELYEELLEKQSDVLRRLKRPIRSRKEWDELQIDIYNVSRGFLSPRALLMIELVDLSDYYCPDRPLWRSERIRHALLARLARDFQPSRQLLFQRGLVREPELPEGILRRGPRRVRF